MKFLSKSIVKEASKRCAFGIFLLLFFLTNHFAFSQTNQKQDSVIELKAVEIKSNSLEEKAAGFEVQKLDSLAMTSYQTSDLGRLLSY